MLWLKGVSGVDRLNIVGTRQPRPDAREKVTGSAIYGTDFRLPGMVYGKILRSPYPHAAIKRLDVSPARRVPGVLAVITGEAFPQNNFGEDKQDEEVLATSKVRFIGDEIAAVAAVDEGVAAEALSKIEVEFEELNAVFDPLAALAPGAPEIHPGGNLALRFEIRRGDVEEGFRRSHLIVENTFDTPSVYPGYLEPFGCVAEPHGFGRVKIWAGSQTPFVLRDFVAEVLGIPASDVTFQQVHTGGAFGGKHFSKLPAIAARLAIEAGRPVRLVSGFGEEMQTARPRVPYYITLKTGVDKDGVIQAKSARIVGDNGAYTGLSGYILTNTMMRSDALYRHRNLYTEGVLAYTNKAPTGAFRGFGNPQMHFAIESQLDIIAHELGVDPIELRKRNANRAGEETVHGWRITSSALRECLDEAAREVDWAAKRRRQGKGYGVGVACLVHVNSNRAIYEEYDGSAALIKLARDGRILVYSPEIDVGQGAATVLAQIVAEVMGTDLAQVQMLPVNTDLMPFGLGVSATRTTTVGGNAVKAAAESCRQQVLNFAAETLSVPVSALTIEGGWVKAAGQQECVSLAELAWRYMIAHRGVPLTASGYFDPGTDYPDKNKFGNISCDYPFGAQIAEVEVDFDTGAVNVLRIVSAHDVGRAINPQLCEGQVAGGVVQGIGYALSEQLCWREGKVANANLVDYKIPSSLDLPAIIPILVEKGTSAGPFGAKGIGEPPILAVAPAVANAIFAATGVRVTSLPVTPEKLLAAMGSSRPKESVEGVSR